MVETSANRAGPLAGVAGMCFGQKSVEEEHGVGCRVSSLFSVCLWSKTAHKRVKVLHNLGAFSIDFRMKVNLVFCTFTYFASRVGRIAIK